VRCTGWKVDKIRKLLLPPEEIWLSAEEAKKLRLCDQIRYV
jgi:hypothetical protein